MSGVTVSGSLLGVGDVNATIQRIISGVGGPVLRAANEKSATEFMSLVKLGAPQDPNDPHGHLIASLKKEDVAPAAVFVSIGDETRKYPAHLEIGHRSKDGKHVPAKPFWYPALRVVKKRNALRLARAERSVIKSAVGSSTSISEVGG